MDNRIVATNLVDDDYPDNKNYGDISQSQIMAKFEETNYDFDPMEYNEYSRRQASDFRPDTNHFEYEDARGGVNKSSGYLQLRHEGHRGNGNWERPDLFLGFGGPEDHEPRGITTDPDFSGLRAQEQFRTKYIRFSAENDQNVTSGGISESQMLEVKKFTNIWKRDNLKVFDRQLDGRREGIKRGQSCESNVNKVELSTDYVDKIKSDALNPTYTSKVIMRDSKNERTWRTSVTDQDYSLAWYASNRKGGKQSKEQKVAQSVNSADQHFTASDASATKKAAKLTMKNITQIAHSVQTNESEFNNMTIEGKNQLIKKKTDLSKILGAVKQDGYFHRSDYAVRYKTPNPQLQVSSVVSMNPDHEVYEINKQIILKSVKEGDIRKAQRQTLQSTDFAEGDLTKTQKAAIKNIQTGCKLKVDGTNMVMAEHMETRAYKRSQQLSKGIRNSDYCALAEADISQIRKTDVKVGRFTSRNVDNQTNFLDNAQQEKLEYRIGAKYMNKNNMERDSSIVGDLQALN